MNYIPFLRTAVELLILTILVHRILLIFRSGRATGIFFTLLLLAAIYGVAAYMNMRVVPYLFRELAPILGIILVIVFQPEIRKALERSGNIGQVLGGLKGRTEEIRQLIELLVKTSEEFATRRTGALIVLEMRGALDSFIETGEVLDAKLSQDLLESIFHHSSPLHDGAVIVRGNRVAAARCFLPLTDSADLPAHFGTRHRAAIGLSEITDAVILVVSEESGRMSVVHLGRVAEGLPAVTLRYQLQSILLPGSNTASPIDARPDGEDDREKVATRNLQEPAE